MYLIPPGVQTDTTVKSDEYFFPDPMQSLEIELLIEHLADSALGNALKCLTECGKWN